MAKKTPKSSSSTSGKPSSNRNLGKDQDHKRGKRQRPCSYCRGSGLVQSERQGAKSGDTEMCKRCGGTGFQDS